MSLAAWCTIVSFGLHHVTKSLVWWYCGMLLCSIPDMCPILPHARLIVTWVSVPVSPARITQGFKNYHRYLSTLVRPISSWNNAISDDFLVRRCIFWLAENHNCRDIGTDQGKRQQECIGSSSLVR